MPARIKESLIFASAIVFMGVLAVSSVAAVAGPGEVLAEDCPERAFGLYCPDDPSPVDNPNLDCPERFFGLYCPDDPSPVDDPNIDCPERAFGLYCPDDPSPVDDPNIDCPERAFGLYCPDDPSPESDPNQNSSGNGGGSNPNKRVGGGGNDEPQPTPQPRTPRVLGISSADLIAPDFIQNEHVPAVVERIFFQVFGRQITHAESVYWKARARSDKATESKLLGAMQWHKAHGSTGPVAGASTYTPGNATGDALIQRINAIFRSVHGRNPTFSEHAYWLSRVGEKNTEAALYGAILFHKQNGISH